MFTLHDVMCTVQTALKITKYGTKHTVPNMLEEVQTIADTLAKEELQTCKLNQSANKHTKPVHDLLYEGSQYANSLKAFKTLTRTFA